ncbi:hypothetical protein PTKU46_92400 [Paraburkholderia terrae]
MFVFARDGAGFHISMVWRKQEADRLPPSGLIDVPNPVVMFCRLHDLQLPRTSQRVVKRPAETRRNM